MLTLGITGGVGAGKSTVLQYLADHYHAHIIEADQVAKRLMQPQGSTYAPLISLLGEDILAADRTIDRGRMAQKMYASSGLIQAVNSIVHPRVKEAIQTELYAIQAPIAVIEAALLEEGGLIPLCDTVWYIHADTAIRIKRLISSRGYTEEKCRQIINSQKSEAEFAAAADRIIDNSHSPEETQMQIRHLLAFYPELEV